jgi:uncharacterized membrane protein YfcA
MLPDHRFCCAAPSPPTGDIDAAPAAALMGRPISGVRLMPESPDLPALLDSLRVFDGFLAQHGWLGLGGAFAVLFVGGLVKGAIGFALPLIALSGMGAFLPLPTALALMIVSALVANIWQAFAFGRGAALRNFRDFRVLNLTALPMIAVGSQILPHLSEQAIFLTLGIVVAAFAALQLSGWRPPDPRGWRFERPLEATVGAAAGFLGGIGGTWGPPITFYLLARRTAPADQVLTMGVSFLLGSIVLSGGLVVSGILDGETGPLSIIGVVPVLMGMGLGLRLAPRLNPATFRRATLAMLVLAGLNLLRRGVMG